MPHHLRRDYDLLHRSLLYYLGVIVQYNVYQSVHTIHHWKTRIRVYYEIDNINTLCLLFSYV